MREREIVEKRNKSTDILVAKVAKVHVAPVVLVGSLLEVDHVLDTRSSGVKTTKHVPASLVPVVGIYKSPSPRERVSVRFCFCFCVEREEKKQTASHQSAHSIIADLIRDITGDCFHTTSLKQFVSTFFFFWWGGLKTDFQRHRGRGQCWGGTA